MPGFTESNITLNFPDINYFRLADCPGYQLLSANHFKEMDACWYDAENNIYWLIELKDFTLANISAAEGIEKRVWDITKKAYDTVCMFLSVKHNYGHAVDLSPCFPSIPDVATKFKVFTIVHCDSVQLADVQLLHNSFRSKFKPYARLFNIEHYGIIEHTKAMTNIPGNIVQ